MGQDSVPGRLADHAGDGPHGPRRRDPRHHQRGEHAGRAVPGEHDDADDQRHQAKRTVSTWSSCHAVPQFHLRGRPGPARPGIMGRRRGPGAPIHLYSVGPCWTVTATPSVRRHPRRWPTPPPALASEMKLTNSPAPADRAQRSKAFTSAVPIPAGAGPRRRTPCPCGPTCPRGRHGPSRNGCRPPRPRRWPVPGPGTGAHEVLPEGVRGAEDLVEVDRHHQGELQGQPGCADGERHPSPRPCSGAPPPARVGPAPAGATVRSVRSDLTVSRLIRRESLPIDPRRFLVLFGVATGRTTASSGPWSARWWGRR